MNIKLLRSFEIIGVLLLLLSIFLAFVGAELLHIPFASMDLVPFALGFSGILLFITGRSAIAYEKNKTRDQLIEEKDERVITINQITKSKSFDLMAILFPFSLLTLAMFGYMNKISFFFLAGLYLSCFIYYKYQFLITKKNM